MKNITVNKTEIITLLLFSARLYFLKHAFNGLLKPPEY